MIYGISCILKNRNISMASAFLESKLGADIYHT